MRIKGSAFLNADANGKQCEHRQEECAPHAPDATKHEHSAGAHSHGHSHGQGARLESRGKLLVVLGLTSVLMLVELVAGYMTHSLALMADAGHMLSDIASQVLALIALWFATKPPNPGKSFGYYRSEILASLINGVILVGISIFILVEAVARLSHPPEVSGLPMLCVAALGLLINAASMKLLHNFADSSLNIKAAYLELFGDLLASGGVLVAAALITTVHWYIVDPLISMAIGIMILPRTFLLLAESTNILMEGTPGHIDLDGLRTALMAVAGVLDVHDIHVWSITTGLDAMSGHVCIAADCVAEEVLSKVTEIAKHDFRIQHTTIQIERVGSESYEKHDHKHEHAH